MRVHATVTSCAGPGAARYGGEEFAIVMPNTDITAARHVAQRLHAAILDLAEPHALDAAHIVTASVGVAAMIPTDRGHSERLVEAADVELYRAKRSGRNQVSGCPPPDRSREEAATCGTSR